MADTSLLFGNTPPQSLTSTTSDTSATLPAWLQDYTRGLMGAATQAAGQPYQQYTGQRLADWSQPQLQSFQTVQNTVGQYQPNLQAANTDVANAANVNQAPNVNQGISNWMNPYVDQVNNRVAQLGQRNLTENLIPQVNSTFTGAGQFGSTRNADFMNRALRDENESVLGQQAQNLNQAYNTAAQSYLQGNQQQMQAGQGLGQLGQLGSQLGYMDSSMLNTIGNQQQNQTQQSLNTAYQDFLNQQQYPQQQLSYLSDIIRGLQVPQSQFTTGVYMPQISGTGSSPLTSALTAMTGLGSLQKALGIGATQ